jgi:hypothetical protein
MKYVLMNTSKHSLNQVFKELKPYTVYLISVYAYTSRHQGEKIDLLCETASIGKSRLCVMYITIDSILTYIKIL